MCAALPSFLPSFAVLCVYPIAPACWALKHLSAKPQPPRCATATKPFTRTWQRTHEGRGEKRRHGKHIFCAFEVTNIQQKDHASVQARRAEEEERKEGKVIKYSEVGYLHKMRNGTELGVCA